MSTLKVNKIENTATTAGGIEVDNTGHVKIDGQQLPTAGPLSNRNLIINGAMRVAQRGAGPSLEHGYASIDRFKHDTGNGIATSQAQETLTSGGPYDEGFRNSFKGTVTSASGAANTTSSYWEFQYRMEGQDIHSSGWNYKSSSSFVTLSYWVKTSLAGTFYNYVQCPDTVSGNRAYRWSVTTEAGVWKKVTKTIPGDSNLVINDDNGSGIIIYWIPYYGTNLTGSTANVDQWDTIENNDYIPDFAQNWGDTNGFTFEVTGVQLEVGSKNTPFEHRSYSDELLKCQRYFYASLNSDETDEGYITGHMWGTGGNAASVYGEVTFPVTMRREPDLIANVVGGGLRNYCENTAAWLSASTGSITAQQAGKSRFIVGLHNWNDGSGGTGGSAKYWTPGFGSWVEKYNATQRIDFNAEF